jgi:hypothetical protein
MEFPKVVDAILLMLEARLRELEARGPERASEVYEIRCVMSDIRKGHWRTYEAAAEKCDHTGIGDPGCEVCDPRARPIPQHLDAGTGDDGRLRTVHLHVPRAEVPAIIEQLARGLKGSADLVSFTLHVRETEV